MKALIPTLFLATLVSLQAQEKWEPLLDGKLSKWEIWMGTPHKSVTGLPPGTPMSEDGYEGIPMGLGNDPKKVFSVKMENGEPLLCISGEILGGLTSLATYSNFHFRTEFKWGERKWEPRLKDKRDNGILYHCTGDHGAFWHAWKRCVEYQVQEGDMGDLYLLSGTRADVASIQVDKKWFYDPKGEVRTFGAGSGAIDGSPAHIKGDFEKPHGEWNMLEIYTVGGKAIHVVNGNVVLALSNACNVEGPDKKIVPLSAGQIQIQSEAAEAFYRKMEIQPIADFPAELKKAAGL